MGHIKLSRYGAKRFVGVRQMDGFHRIGIDPAPDSMRMAAQFTILAALIMEDDDPRLIRQTQSLFGLVDRLLKSSR